MPTAAAAAATALRRVSPAAATALAGAAVVVFPPRRSTSSSSSAASSGGVALCQPAPPPGWKGTRSQRGESSDDGGGDSSAEPSLDMRFIAGDGKTNSSPTEIAARARREMEDKYRETYENHPCGDAMRGWHLCVLDQLGGDVPEVDDDAAAAAGRTKEQVLALKRAALHRRCADPHLLSLLACLKEQQARSKQKIVNEVGEDKFRAMLREHDRKVARSQGYDYVKRREEAQVRTDALVEAFREREGLPAAPGPGPSPEEEAAAEAAAAEVEPSSSSEPLEERKWWQAWKSDNDGGGGGTTGGGGGGGGEDPLWSTEEGTRRKEELRAEADAMLRGMERGREEREDAAARERGAGLDGGEEGEGGGGGGGKGWWRFGF